MVTVREILDRVDGVGWTWRLDWFHGLTKPGADVAAIDLERRTSGGQYLEFDRDSLRRFSTQIHQMADGRLAAFDRQGQEPVLSITAEDSTRWVIEARGDSARAVDTLARISGLKDPHSSA